MSDKVITLISPEMASRVKEYASLRYTISQIALLMEIPVEEFRMRVNIKDDILYQSYHAGILESQAKYRKRVKEKAEAGAAWAITILERWERAQLEEELGGYV